MASIKFSAFTNEAVDAATTQLVGYKVGDTSANYRYSIGQLATALTPYISTFYTGDGSINEDRVVTVGHDSTTKASYTTTFDSNKSTNSTTRNSAYGNRFILTETVTSAPTSYSTIRGAGISLTHNSDGDDVTGSINVQSVNSGSSDYYGRSQMGFRTNTGFVFAQTAGWSGDTLIVRDSLASNVSKSLRYDTSGSDGGRLRLCAPNAKTSRILLATDISNTFYRYIEGDNNGNLVLGRKLSSGSDEEYITMSGIGGWSGDIAVGINQSTPTETLEVGGNCKITGQGYTELNDIGTVATATWDIDWNNSNIQSITLNNGGAMTLNTPTNPKTGATYILKLIQGASPSTITWTASIFKWPAATAPVLSTSAGQVDIVTLIYDGTNYYGTSTINLS